MDNLCRLCCSSTFVRNNIFDEENALYLKMSLYLPIKIFKNDGLPHKVCDKCSCKVNDFYQFCNETIEVQGRLRALVKSNGFTSDVVDLTRVKQCASPIPDRCVREQATQTEWDTQKSNSNQLQIKEENIEIQVDMSDGIALSPLKEESYDNGGFSDNSDDISLLNLKNKKSQVNGVKKRGRKKKEKLKDWDMLMNVIPENSLESGESDLLKENDCIIKEEKKTPNEGELVCCVCFNKFNSQSELLQHYNKHATPVSSKYPVLPPLPEKEPYRCIRCDKIVSASDWSAHWSRHWELDTRPYRCGVCEKTFRSTRQLLKHGLGHAGGAGAEARGKMFSCDACGEAFSFLRSLCAHRVAAHPEAAARPLRLACAQCGRRFAHANSLRRHLTAHSGERNYLCNVCGKALTSREHLKFHIRIHTGDKRNVCGVCGKGFVKKSNLTLHERVHSGEKPHVCSHCGKAFSQRSTLVIHERYHSGARPYACELCGRGFVAKGLLTVHLKSTCI